MRKSATHHRIVQTMYEYTPPEDDSKRAYVLVDNMFDVHMLRTEEGLIVDVYGKDEIECLATLAVHNDDVTSFDTE
jgi:hypothetical protein